LDALPRCTYCNRRGTWKCGAGEPVLLCGWCYRKAKRLTTGGGLLATFSYLLEALDYIVYSVAYQSSAVVLRGPYGNVSHYGNVQSLRAMTHHVESNPRKGGTI